MPLVCSRLAILCLAVEAFLLAGCAAPQSSTVPPPVASPALQTYRCPDEFSFSVEAGRDTARLFLPGRTLRLPRAEAASGAKYQRGVVTFWAKGQQEALLDLEEATYKRCRRTEELTPWDQARQRGVDFRATGNDPGWQFDIERGRRITFVGDYGRKRVIVPAPAPRRRGGDVVYRAETEAHTLTVTIAEGPCRDTMSGRRIEKRVTVILDEQRHRGCGWALR